MNKTALITWWTAGIGFWIAKIFAEAGINLVISYAHNESRAKEVEEKLSKYWIKILVVKADSGNKQDLIKLFEESKKIGKIDILVNNIWASFPDDDNENEWEDIFHHHMMGTVNATELFAKQAEEGVIINISSVLWVDPLLIYKWARLESYSCIKAAVNMYTKIIANKFSGKIRVNSIAPGNTETEWWQWSEESFKEMRRKWILIHRFVNPEEIGKFALQLVENEALNWQVFVIDGWVVGKGYE